MKLGPAAVLPIVAGERASRQTVLVKQQKSTTPGIGLIIDASLRLSVIELKVCTFETPHFILKTKTQRSDSNELTSMFTGRHALIYFHMVSQSLRRAKYDIISRTGLNALRRLFSKDAPLPRSERGKEMERVAREEGIRELETATATVKRMKKADMEVGRRNSV